MGIYAIMLPSSGFSATHYDRLGLTTAVLIGAVFTILTAITFPGLWDTSSDAAPKLMNVATVCRSSRFKRRKK